MHCNSVQCSKMHCSELQCNAVQSSAMSPIIHQAVNSFHGTHNVNNLIDSIELVTTRCCCSTLEITLQYGCCCGWTLLYLDPYISLLFKNSALFYWLHFSAVEELCFIVFPTFLCFVGIFCTYITTSFVDRLWSFGFQKIAAQQEFSLKDQINQIKTFLGKFFFL